MELRKNWKSELACFHDQKSGDFDPETGVMYSPFCEWEDHLEFNYNKESLNEKKHLEKVLKMINDIGIISSVENFSEQTKELAKRKDVAKNLIMDVFLKIKKYLETIRTMKHVRIKRENMKPEEYRIEMEKTDKNRRLAHNALIDSINIANRFINFNFGKIEDSLLEEWKDNEEKFGRNILDVERVSFPVNMICSDWVNLNDRKQVMEWAIQLACSISDLNENL